MIAARCSTISMMLQGAEATKLTFLLICILSVSSWTRFSLWNVRVAHYNLCLMQFFCFIQDSVFMIHRNKVLHSSTYYDWDGREALKADKRFHAYIYTHISLISLGNEVTYELWKSYHYPQYLHKLITGTF